VVWRDVEEASAYALDAQRGRCRENRRAAARLLRDVFGSPFCPSPAIAAARLTPPVLALAATIYEARRWEDMPVLGDALAEAGCADAEILAHCREAGPHARGCWLVDLLLKKG
jgi:hypothetical protein